MQSGTAAAYGGHASRDSRVPVTITGGCDIVTGDWSSYLDGYSTTSPAELDVDHTVALAEAWDSGAWAWDTPRRQAFANDLDTPGALRAVSAAENQRKSDRGHQDRRGSCHLRRHRQRGVRPVLPRRLRPGATTTTLRSSNRWPTPPPTPPSPMP